MDKAADHFPQAERNTVRAVERSLDILLCFTESEDNRLGLTEISRRVNLHKSTVHRLLASLESRGFVRRDGNSDLYQLGWRILELTSHVYHSDDMSIVLLPLMTELRDLLGETISLYIRDGSERIRIQAVEGTQPIRRVANVGRRFPLYIGASGKIFLAYSEPSTIEELQATGILPPELRLNDLTRQLAAVRAQGFAVSIQEREMGAAAVAVPIFDNRDTVIAALTVSGPLDRYHAENVAHYATEAKQYAMNMSKLLWR